MSLSIMIRSSILIAFLGGMLSTSVPADDFHPEAWLSGPWKLAADANDTESILVMDGNRLERLLTHAELASRVLIGDLPILGGATIDLDLEVVPGLTPDAELVVVDSRGRARGRRIQPTIALAGEVIGDPDGEAFLAFGPSGVEGWIRSDGVVLGVSDGPGRGVPRMVRLDSLPPIAPDLLENFCSADLIEQPLQPYGPFQPGDANDPSEDAAGGVAGDIDGPCQRLRVAIETDNEFLGLFGGDQDAAMGYVATLCAATTYIYGRDVNAAIVAHRIRLWVGEDPWTGSNTSSQLNEFRDWWQSNEQTTPRDLAHFLSGRGLGGGVAWLPGLCSSFNYAVSANMNGSFPYPVENNSGQNWDLMVFVHETGHNCGAPHTHSIGVDDCAGGDCSVAPNGTVMSYCHTCPGGMANMRMEFHPLNIANITETIDGVGCDYDVDEDAMVQNDAATAVAGTPVVIDVAANDIGESCGGSNVLGFDETSIAGGTIVRVPEWIPGGRDALQYTPPPGFSGTDSFTYRARPDGQVGSGTVTVVVEEFDARPPENPTGTVAGIAADFFVTSSSDSVLPDFSTLEPYGGSVHPQIDFPSTGGEFVDTGRSDDVGVVWIGWVEVPQSGFWTFETESDDGSRLLIGDELVVDNDGLHGMRDRSGTIALQAGVHAIRVEFFERGGGAGCIVRFGGPDQAFGVIPASAWSHGGGKAPSPDFNDDGSVDGADMGILLSGWSQPGLTDLDGDGTTNGTDLGLLLVAWTG